MPKTSTSSGNCTIEDAVNQNVWTPALYEDQKEHQDKMPYEPTSFSYIINILHKSLVHSATPFWFGCKAATYIKWNATTGVNSAAKISEAVMGNLN